MNVEADGFLGAVLAAEGVAGLKTMINGPGGCRSRTQIVLKELMREYCGEDTGCCSSKYFSRQSKLPCTYLNSNDMIMGSSDKITDGLRSVLSVSDADMVLIDTLGASIQVTDNKNAMRKAQAEERTILGNRYLSSMTMYEGFDDTIVRIVKHICSSETGIKIPNTVNILGYNVSDSGWEYGKKELSNLLKSIGIDVISFIGCNCTKEDVKGSVNAALNILIHPECSIRTAEYYHDVFDIPYLIPDLGSPVGYPSLISFIQEISEKFGTDFSNSLKNVQSDYKEVNKILMNSEKAVGGLRGSECFITGIPSDILPIIKWMYEHFSVLPGCVRILGDEPLMKKRLLDYLEEIDCTYALDADSSEKYEIIFTDGMTSELIKRKGSTSSCVGYMYPYHFGTSLVNRSLIGTYGCRYILDEIINSRRIFYCGQPTMADFR